MTIREELKHEDHKRASRRYFFRECAMGLGSMALATLMNDKPAFARTVGQSQSLNPLSPKKPHFAPKAKRVIYLFQAGAPSQLDLFDPKPALEKYNGQPVPKELIKDQMYAFIPSDAGLFASPFKFARHGAVWRRDVGVAAQYCEVGR